MRTPSQVFLDRLPATIELSLLALVLAIALGIPLGYIAARRHGLAVDTGAVIFSLVGVAVPVFFTAFLLKYFFAVEWNLLPVSGPPDHRARRHPGDRDVRPRRDPHPRVGRRRGTRSST